MALFELTTRHCSSYMMVFYILPGTTAKWYWGLSAGPPVRYIHSGLQLDTQWEEGIKKKTKTEGKTLSCRFSSFLFHKTQYDYF